MFDCRTINKCQQTVNPTIRLNKGIDECDTKPDYRFVGQSWSPNYARFYDFRAQP